MFQFKFKFLIIPVLYGLNLCPVSASVRACGTPTLVKDATVSTVVLGYRDAGRNTAIQGTLARVSLLTFLDGLFSQIKYNNRIELLQVAREHESELDDPCPPSVIVDQLSQKMPPNHALVFLWGNLFEDGNSIFIQSFVEIQRGDRNDDLTFSWQRANQDYWFSAGLPINRVAFPPHKVPKSAIQELSAAYETLAVIHDEPNFGSSSKPLKADPEDGDPFSIFVDQVQGTWMHLSSFNKGSVGWVNVGEVDREWPIRKYFPELDFIEGAVGYLLVQGDREYNNPMQQQADAFFKSALRRFIEITPDDETGTSALALAKSMQGIVEFRESSMQDVTPELRKTFDDVVKLVPFSSPARNLKAIVDLKTCCSRKLDDLGTQDVINQIMDAIRLEPTDVSSLSNLENLYLALGSPNAKKVHEVREALNNVSEATQVANIEPKKSQAAFLRMRALNWYDVKLSKKQVQVNEKYEITGKLHVTNAWPTTVQGDNHFKLTVNLPGPVVPVANSGAVLVGGQFTPRSVTLDPGKTYEFRTLVKARRPGHWCRQFQLNVENSEPIPGPGQCIDIKGNESEFTDSVKMLNGTKVDIEDYGQGKIDLWHLVWIIAGGAWILYWFNKRGLIGRLLAGAIGQQKDQTITPQERLVGAGIIAAVMGVVIASYYYAITASNYPSTIPLQSGDIGNIKLGAEASAPLKIKYLSGSYKVPGRELVANFRITNEGKEAVRIGEYTTAGLRFLNPDVYTAKVDYPDYLLAERGLSLSDNAPIQPGETKDITVTVQDTRWDTDVDSSFAGLLFFFTPTGTRYPVEVGGPVIPTFVPG